MVVDSRRRTPEGFLADQEERVVLLERRLARGVPARLSTTGQEVTDWHDVTEVGFYWGGSAVNAPESGLVVATAKRADTRLVLEASKADVTPSSRARTWRNLWVDGSGWQGWVEVGGTQLLTTEDLNSITTTGTYQQTKTADATAARHYPPPLRAGTLFVTYAIDPSGTVFVTQRYVDYQNLNEWSRTLYTWAGASWTAWKDVSVDPANKILWSGAVYMNGSQSISLSEPVSAQRNGIVLHWQFYDGSAALNRNHTYTFVPKAHVQFNAGGGVSCLLEDTDSNGVVTPLRKYVYVNDNSLAGNAANVGTALNYRVLTQVIGV